MRLWALWVSLACVGIFAMLGGTVWFYIHRWMNTLEAPRMMIDDAIRQLHDKYHPPLPCSVIQSNGACQPGTVQIDAVQLQITQTQNALQKRVSIDKVFYVGSHRSFHTRGDGYGFGDKGYGLLLRLIHPHMQLKLATHEYSLMDQIRMGLRVITLELHMASGHVALCHSSSGIPQLNALLPLADTLSQIGNAPHFFCDTMSRKLEDVLREHKQWLDAHPTEFLWYMIKEDDQLLQNKADDPITIYESVFGPESIYASGRDNAQWPAIQQLVAQKKRVMLTCASASPFCYEKTEARKRVMTYIPYIGQKALAGCEEEPTNKFRVMHGGSLALFTFAYENIKWGYLDPPMMDAMKQNKKCQGLNFVLLDDYNQTMASAMDWTWSPNTVFPLAKNADCAVLLPGAQRWEATLCDTQFQFLCRGSDGMFRPSVKKGRWNQGTEICEETESGLEFWAPTNPWEQMSIFKSFSVPLWIHWKHALHFSPV